VPSGRPLLVACLVFAGACGREGESTARAEQQAAPLPVDGAVSADTPEATRAGLEILARGGNAVDAAVAVSLVLGVTEPSESGLGGSVVLLFLPAGGHGTLIDSPPSTVGDSTTLTSPGALRVLHHAWSRYGSGRLTWEELVEPAIRVAEDGYALGTFSHHTMVLGYDRIVDDPAATHRLLAPDRSIPSEGTHVANPELARVLQEVAAGGPEAFYAGAVGRRLAHELAKREGGGSLTAAALAATPAAREVPAQGGGYRRRVVWSAPTPYGGPALERALGFLELIPSAWLERDASTRIAWTLEALAFSASRERLHPVQRLAELPPLPAAPPESVASADSAALPLAASDAGASAPSTAAPVAGTSTAETRRDGPGAGTHFSVVDGEGNAVSASQTLGVSYGSGLVEPLGFFYQSAGASRGSEGLVPAIVTRDGKVELVLGSPGGDRGVAAVVQVLSRLIDLGQPLDEALIAPRLQVAPPGEHDRGRVFLEGAVWNDSTSVPGGAQPSWSPSTEAMAHSRGFATGEQPSGPWPADRDPWFGGVNAVARSGEGWSAVGDERRNAFGGVLAQGAQSLRPADAPATEPREAPEG
jgi:gamma-glutamyltranspeptidase / glutathione hydrolase